MPKRHSPWAAGHLGRVQPEFAVIGGKGLLPTGLGFQRGRGRRVAKKVDVIGRTGGHRQGLKFGLQGVRAEYGRRQCTQPTGLANGQGQTVVLRARHGGLKNGRVQTQLCEGM